MLTVEKLKGMTTGSIIAEGTVSDNAIGVNMSDSDRLLRWVAVRGHGPADWAIYCHFAENDSNWVRSHGDKIGFPEHIKKLVPCDDEALAHYRR